MLKLIVVCSDVERQFGAKMLKAMRAGQRMFRRAVVAVTGDENSEAVERVEKTVAAGLEAVPAAEPVVDGDSATRAFAPGGARGTAPAFRKPRGGGLGA